MLIAIVTAMAPATLVAVALVIAGVVLARRSNRTEITPFEALGIPRSLVVNVAISFSR